MIFYAYAADKYQKWELIYENFEENEKYHLINLDFEMDSSNW